MTSLDGLIPEPRWIDVDHIDVAATAERAWQAVRHGDLVRSPLVRALLELRTLPSRVRDVVSRATGSDTRFVGPAGLSIDSIVAHQTQPGFRLLAEVPGHELAVGAIGPVWKPDIPFIDVRDASAFAAFDEPGNAKVAWAVRVEPRGEHGARVFVEVRVSVTDDASWQQFRRYFRLIGPGSRFLRKSLLASLQRELGAPHDAETTMSLPGDDLLADAQTALTHGIEIRATPAAIWPWLVQMGADRGGFYSLDVLDNANRDSAREIHPELQELFVGQIIAAAPGADDGFEVLRIEPERTLVLGGLYDARAGSQLPFAASRPRDYWHVTWAFVLEPLDAASTRLRVRARAAFAESQRLHAFWIRGVHHLMETSQLRGLAARAEGRLARDTWRDIGEGLVGASAMVLDLLTPFLRPARSHWGLDESTASRRHPGDDLVAEPRWGWTHGVEIEAPAEDVWPWVAQIGADRGGFYSYQWLENLAGCDVRNAEVVRPEWAHRVGSALSLHPKAPPMSVVAMEAGRWLVAHAPADPSARASGRPWVAASWLLMVEALGADRCRFVSRFRSACSPDLATRLENGPYVAESIGFVMDRKMLLGVRERAERAARA